MLRRTPVHLAALHGARQLPAQLDQPRLQHHRLFHGRRDCGQFHQLVSCARRRPGARRTYRANPPGAPRLEDRLVYSGLLLDWLVTSLVKNRLCTNPNVKMTTKAKTGLTHRKRQRPYCSRSCEQFHLCAGRVQPPCRCRSGRSVADGPPHGVCSGVL